MSSHLVVPFALGGAGGIAQSFEQSVLSEFALHGQDGAGKVVLPLVCLAIAEEVDGRELLGQEVAEP